MEGGLRVSRGVLKGGFEDFVGILHNDMAAGGGCARGSCAGPLRVQEQYILFAWRRRHQKRGLCAGSAVLIPFDAARVPFIRKPCGRIVWRGSTRVHARLRRKQERRSRV